jgi:hypothetical protein
MNHLSEQDLILHYYGETQDPAPVDRHLDTCHSCRAAYGALERVLNIVDALPVPERGAAYESDMWRRVKPHVGQAFSLPPDFSPARRRWGWPALRWPAAAVACASLVAAFLAGRFSIVSQAPRIAPAVRFVPDTQLQDRVLRSAVADYLDRTGMVLVELANATPDASVDISGEQERAADLLTESRLYQQTALRAGDHLVAGVLDELARVLLEIAHAPSRLEPGQLDDLRLRLRSEGILFRIRVLGATVRDQDAQKL